MMQNMKTPKPLSKNIRNLSKLIKTNKQKTICLVYKQGYILSRFGET